LTAVSWLVTRNTTGLDLNRFATTKEDDKNKGRRCTVRAIAAGAAIDMYSQGDRGRCIQISKARGVAMSLILMSLEQTLDAGRKGLGQREAIEGTSMRLMLESATPHIAAWIMADTLEHMFRTDLVILMQMLGQKLGVPADVDTEQVLQWLQTGNVPAALRDWWERQQRVVASPLNDTRVGSAEIADCFYLTHHDLQACIPFPIF
jgi:hypothetical protein